MVRDAELRLPPNLYLVGMMASGKTTLGRMLAAALGRPFLDLDELIEEEAGMTIAEIFEREGEEGFRARETRALLQVSRERGLVVSLGGGAVLREENRRAIRATGYSIYLKVRPETALARLPEHPIRPLLSGLEWEERLALLRRLLAIREPYYREADLVIENEGPPEATLERLLHELRQRGWAP